MSSASNLLNLIKQTNVDTSSYMLGLTVKSINPLQLTDQDKLVLTSEFVTFAKYIDTSKIEVGDKFRAISLNYGQSFYITEIISSTYELDKYIQRIKALENRFD